MFFYLSKTFWFVAQPLNLAIFLLIGGLLFARLRFRRTSWLALCLSLLVLVTSVWTSVGAVALGKLEDRFPRPAMPERVDGIVVLGGGMEGAVNMARGGYDLNMAGDRFVEAAILARRFPNAKVLVSGGTGNVLLDGIGDAEAAPRLFEGLGIGRDRLILDNESRNTYENALFSHRLATPQPGETWLLVTSAFHMPRSMGLFRKVGFDVVPWPTDYRTSGTVGLGFFKDDPNGALLRTTEAMREWTGLVSYWLSGRIDSPFPAP